MLTQDRDIYQPISEINVTPFVDVLLVLLVVFMITAPLFTKAIKVQLPQENLRSSTVKDARKLIISVDRKGRYHIEGRRYPTKKLLPKLIEWKERNPQNTAFIRATVARLSARIKASDCCTHDVINGFVKKQWHKQTRLAG